MTLLFHFPVCSVGRTATCSAEADKVSVLPHSAAGGGRELHFTLLIIYIIGVVSCSSLASIQQMVTCQRLGQIKELTHKHTTSRLFGFSDLMHWSK